MDPLTKAQIVIKQKVLRMLGTAIGIIDPYNEESIREMIFRLQLFLPESIIQKSHYNSDYLLTFFYEGQQLFITVKDLMILASRSKAGKHVTETRQDFSSQIFDRKARLIKVGIQKGIFFLVPRSHDLKSCDFLLLPEFPGHDADWIYSIEIFSWKVAMEVAKGI